MSYPRNAASPPRIAVGAVVQISDGAVQTSGCSVVVRAEGGAEGAGSGTVAYGATSGIVYYTPTQGETDYTAFAVVAYKSGCLPATVTVITSASATAGYGGVDWGKVTNPTTTVGLSGTTVKTATDVETDTADIQARIPAALVSGRIDASVGAMAANTLTASALATDAVTEIQSGLSTLTQTQVTGGAYALNSASFAFNAALDFTTTQKASTLARVTLVDTTTTNTDMLTQANVRTAVGLASANLDTQLTAIVGDTNELQTDWVNGGRLDLLIDAIKAKTDNLPAAPAATGDIPTVSQIWTTALTEAYRATGATGTAAQLLYEILQNITEFSITTTTKTVKKLDGSTTAKTYTLDSSTAPTSITEAT